jgi:hypothetical protein
MLGNMETVVALASGTSASFVSDADAGCMSSGAIRAKPIAIRRNSKQRGSFIVASIEALPVGKCVTG